MSAVEPHAGSETDPLQGLDVVAIDFEASCLPAHGRSFPIEVGVCHVATGVAKSWLIRPVPAWDHWGWDPDAEKTHHISRAMLEVEGLPARRVWADLSGFCDGCTVISDSPLDVDWLATLSAGAAERPMFKITQATDLFERLSLIGGAVGEAQIAQAHATALGRIPEIHRAGPDARRLAETARVLAGLSPT